MTASNDLCYFRVWPFPQTAMGVRWGGGGSHFVTCRSHLIIGHASLSRRSIVPTPNRHLQHLGAHLRYFLPGICYVKERFACLTVGGYHLRTPIGLIMLLSLNLSETASQHQNAVFLYTVRTQT